MQVLTAMNGGVAAASDIAYELAMLLAKAFTGQNSIASLELADQGHSWRVKSAEISLQGDGAFYFDIEKVDATVSPGPDIAPSWTVIDTSDTARSFALIALRSIDQAGAIDQLPLTAADCGDFWLIRGSLNRDRASEGPGRFRAYIQKRDAKVLDIGFEYVLRAPPEVRALLQKIAPKKV